MLNPLLLLGASLIGVGVVVAGRNAALILPRTRVQGTILRIEEVTDFGLSDSTHRLVIGYQDRSGKHKEVTTRPRATLGWYSIGDALPVYLPRTSDKQAIIGGFQELWLIPALCSAVGLLCLVLVERVF